jgi:hypothetical protein
MNLIFYISVYLGAGIHDSQGSVELIQGGVYTITITEEENINNLIKVKVFKLTNENTVNILWQFPQHFLLAVGEVLLAITGLNFSYSQVNIFSSYFPKEIQYSMKYSFCSKRMFVFGNKIIFYTCI